MEVKICIKVRNPEWYWTAKDIKDSKGYYEEWKLLNEDKVYKHVNFVEFEFNFPVLNYEDTRNGEINVLYGEIDEQTNLPEWKVAKFTNMTVARFKGEIKSEYVALSNDIIHQFIGAKNKKGKLYWYFYIKEDIECKKLDENIWLSEEQTKIFGSKSIIYPFSKEIAVKKTGCSI
ncbi:MAG: hypothetical protein J0M08_06735 [Bacteroidetes bacterium]|nr:hypothetical protein [Bacteroidota bacterium]